MGGVIFMYNKLKINILPPPHLHFADMLMLN